MDNLVQLAMQMLLCLLIAALLGAIIGYLLGKMSKCDKENDYDNSPSGEHTLHSYDNDTNASYSERESEGIAKGDTSSAMQKAVDAGEDALDSTKSGIAGMAAAAATAGSGIVESAKEGISEVKEGLSGVGQEIGIRPMQFDGPLQGEADDLKEISGVGLKIEEVLNSLGIFNFKQIAEWSPENVEWIENYLSFRGRIKKEDWIGQAKLLAAGNATEFSERVKKGEGPDYTK